MGDLIERTAKELIRSRYAIALTGAGISTESGIPDFRGMGRVIKDAIAAKPPSTCCYFLPSSRYQAMNKSGHEVKASFSLPVRRTYNLSNHHLEGI